MARSEARISVDIWDDPDFVALTPDAQRMFLFLLSQRDLAHDGVLALRERRWARSAAGLTAATINTGLDELTAARFTVVDEDTEELLVRSLIRRDKVYRQPNILRAAADHLPLVSSRIIRAAILEEVLRIQAAEDVPEGSWKILAEMAEALTEPIEKGSENPYENPSRKDAPGTPGDRGVVTAVSSDSPSPYPRTPNPGSLASLTHPDAAAPRESKTTKPNPADFDAFWAAYPRRDDKGHARTAFTKALRKVNAQTLIAGAQRYAAACAQEGKQRKFIALPSTWLNGERWGDEADAEPVESVDEAEKRMRALTDGQPPCDHHMPGGRIPHPRTGQPLCPMCRRDLPPDFDENPDHTPEPVMAALDVYRANRAGPLDAHTLHVITAEALALHTRGVGQDLLTALAATAAQAGVGLLTAATRTETHVA